MAPKASSNPSNVTTHRSVTKALVLPVRVSKTPNPNSGRSHATTQGMQGQPALDLALDALPQNAVVMDAVYTPLLTPLLAAAQRRGNQVVDGLGMLLHQARPGFAAWFGQQPVVDQDVRDHILLDL